MKLHLGCGNDKKEGYINCDISKEVNPDMIIDLNENLPFEDNSVNEIITFHTLEHIKELPKLIGEFKRVCVDGARIKIKVPFYLSHNQFTDPTHVRFFTPWTFDYFIKGTTLYSLSYEIGLNKGVLMKDNVILRYGFNNTLISKHIMNPLMNLNHRIYCKLFAGIFPASEIEFNLIVKK